MLNDIDRSAHHHIRDFSQFLASVCDSQQKKSGQHVTVLETQ